MNFWTISPNHVNGQQMVTLAQQSYHVAWSAYQGITNRVGSGHIWRLLNLCTVSSDRTTIHSLAHALLVVFRVSHCLRVESTGRTCVPTVPRTVQFVRARTLVGLLPTRSQ